MVFLEPGGFPPTLHFGAHDKYQETTPSNSHTACTDVKKALRDIASSFSSPVALSLSDR